MSWKDNVKNVVPYTPGEQPKLKKCIKLNTNENPYPPAPAIKKVLENIDINLLRKYPDPSAAVLVDALAEYYGVKPSQVFVGVGSDDVLANAFLTFFNSDKPILFPDVTYSFYDVWAKLFDIPYRQMPLDDDFKIIIDDYLQPNGGIVIANPNAPTGVELEAGLLEQIIAANQDSVCVIDEAYVDFGAVSALPLIEKYDNLLVVQTFSKSRSLAGIRIGFAMGSEELISYMWAVRNSINSYTMNLPAIEVGKAALADETYFRETLDKIIGTREWAKEKFRQLGFSFGDSRSNFIFARQGTVPAKEIFAELRKENIFVRYFSAERTCEHIRVTIGTREEMQEFFDCLEKIIRSYRR